jgi:hypothetical protein
VWLKHWKPDQSFKLPATNNGTPWDAAAITQWKRAKVLDLTRRARLGGGSNDRVWWWYNDAGQSPRYHPWHPSLDLSMFWM